MYTLRIFTFWTIPECSCSGPFKSLNILDHSWILEFQTIPEFLHSGPLQIFHILDLTSIFIYWSITEFLFCSQFQNFYILDHSRTFTFRTVPELLHSGLMSTLGSHFIGLSESVKILGVQGILGMGQLFYASRHCLKRRRPLPTASPSPKGVCDGHDRSLGSWPWQKGGSAVCWRMLRSLVPSPCLEESSAGGVSIMRWVGGEKQSHVSESDTLCWSGWGWV